jgi:hypothetical protein
METAVFNIPPQDDEIVLNLVDQELIVHKTVRIQVQVIALRDPNTKEEEMRAKIKTALQQFVAADWRFAKVTRSRTQTRFEQIAVAAVCRAPESEHVQLDERAAMISTTDIQLIGPVGSYALPFEEVQAVNQRLRVKLTKQAQAECKAHSEAVGIEYRIGSIVFSDTPRGGGMAANMRAGSTYAANTAHMQYNAPTGAVDLEAADTGATDLAETERYWVAAEVTLRASRNGE